MALLDTASLIVTPNGYKASKLYSIVPTDGTGDMTFSRTGDTATRVNATGLVETVLANKPRLDYTGGGCPKLLLEPQRTNLLTYSEQFDNAAWSKLNVTVTANNTTSPDGTTNADKIITGTTGNKCVYQTISAGTISVSVFAKAAGYNGLVLATGAFGAFFNLTTGVVRGTYATPPTSTSITSMGNGWYRCTIVGTLAAGDNIYIGPNDNASNTLGAGFTGNSVDGVYLYGAQLEAGAYATSYIPTTTASVTRNADTCNKTSATALIGQTEGTLFSEFTLDYINSTIYRLCISISDGTYANSIGILVNNNSGQQYTGYVNNAGTLQAAISSSNVTSANIGTRYKIAFSYKANDFVFYINGVQIGADTSGTIPSSLSRIDIGTIGLTGLSALDCQSNRSIALWKTRLTNSELAQLTTL
jgi:hypothetical protein